MDHSIKLELEIVFSSRWHAGSGEGSFLCDRLVRRDAKNRPYIPGSTLKGIIRQSCEKLSRTLGFPTPSDPHQQDLTQDHGFLPYERIQSPVDKLFGTRFAGSDLFFRDARTVQTDASASLNMARTARYRTLQTVKDKHLFTTEYRPPDVLQTTIEGWHQNLVSFDEDYPPFAYCLLIAGILSMNRIGGDKSTGAGWLAFPATFRQAHYNGAPIEIGDVFEFLNPQDYFEIKEGS